MATVSIALPRTTACAKACHSYVSAASVETQWSVAREAAGQDRADMHTALRIRCAGAGAESVDAVNSSAAAVRKSVSSAR